MTAFPKHQICLMEELTLIQTSEGEFYCLSEVQVFASNAFAKYLRGKKGEALFVLFALCTFFSSPMNLYS